VRSIMTYTLIIPPSIEKTLDKLPVSIRNRILSRIEYLKIVPRPPGMRKLKGEDDLFRIRIGDYRIIYTIEDMELVIIIIRIGKSNDVYRKRF